MNSALSSLRGKNVGVVGFNARPLACSAKNAGARVFVSDYWGDDDLYSCCSKAITVLNPKPGERPRQALDTPLQKALAMNLLEITDGEDIDYILVGSGFDDHTKFLRIVEKKLNITGNSVRITKRARDQEILRRLAEKVSVNFPEKERVDSKADAISVANTMGYPVVLRPLTSGGGSGIRFMRNDSDVDRFFRVTGNSDSETRYYIQEYIRGLDISCSVLSMGHNSKALSVQGQLIGLPSAGRNCDFVYCGNYIPLNLGSETLSKVSKTSELLCNELGLIGSNGIDYVIDNDSNIWLMEINPRFQGTLEMLEIAGKISVTSLHVAACNGELPTRKIHFRPSVKMIIYSRSSGRISDLGQMEETVDRTPRGSIVRKGDPVCSVITTSDDTRTAFGRARMIAGRIQESIQ